MFAQRLARVLALTLASAHTGTLASHLTLRITRLHECRLTFLLAWCAANSRVGKGARMVTSRRVGVSPLPARKPARYVATMLDRSGTSPMDRGQLNRVVAIHNRKGGAKKTSIATNCSAIFGAAGFRTLLVDLDPQANCGEDLGYSDQVDDGQGLRDSLLTGNRLRPNLTARENLHVVAGGQAMERFEAPDGRSPYDLLAASLIPIADRYEVIVLDTPPGADTIIDMALGATRYLVIPTSPDRSSIKGLESVNRSVVEARRHNPMLTLLGAILVDVATNATVIRAEAMGDLETSLGDPGLMFQHSLRTAAKPAKQSRDRGLLAHELAAEADNGRPFWEYLNAGEKPPPNSRSAPGLADDYVQISQEILLRMNAEEQRLDTIAAELADPVPQELR